MDYVIVLRSLCVSFSKWVKNTEVKLNLIWSWDVFRLVLNCYCWWQSNLILDHNQFMPKSIEHASYKAADRLILCDGRIKGWKEGQLHEMNRKNWDIPKLRPHYSKLTGWHCSEFLHVLHKAVNSCVHCVPPENIDQSYVSFSTSSVDLTAKNVINQMMIGTQGLLPVACWQNNWLLTGKKSCPIWTFNKREVWDRLDNIHPIYNNFLFYGK